MSFLHSYLKRFAAGFRNKRAQFIMGVGIASITVITALVVASGSRKVSANPLPPDSDLRDGFANPATSYRTMVRWWWPGGDVTDEEISRELRLMKEAGIGGVEIQSFVIGLNPKPTPEVKARVQQLFDAGMVWPRQARHRGGPTARDDR